MPPTRPQHVEIDLEPVLDPLRDIDVATNGPRGPLAPRTDAAGGTTSAAAVAADPGAPLPSEVRIAIVGAGFGGIDAAIQLLGAGERDLLVLDRAEGPSGCWRANTYPGIACDVPSNLYSFSYAPNPDWTRTYSRGGEIADYIAKVARDFGALEHIRFGVSVQSARWLEAEQRWELTTDAGTLRAQFVIGAMGPLSEPIYPDIEGRESFEGIQMHSAQWDHDIDFAGKRIAVIGTGASAIQFVPELAKVAGHLDVYQRTAPWVLPRTDRPTTAFERKLYRVLPITQRASRTGIYWAREILVAGMRGNKLIRGVLQAIGKSHLRRQVPDAELRRRLEPKFDIGCKRILLSNTWYPTLGRKNVDVIGADITSIQADGVVTADGQLHQVDAIVYGTGFHVTDSPVAGLITGDSGVTLAEHWAGSPKAYLGTTIDGFPNLFMLVGPNSGVGHTSILLSIEWQVNYLKQAITAATRGDISSYRLRPETMDAWVGEVDGLSKGTVWLDGGCSSYYLDVTGRNSSTWPTYTWKLRDRLATFDPAAYSVRRAEVPATPADAGRVKA